MNFTTFMRATMLTVFACIFALLLALGVDGGIFQQCSPLACTLAPLILLVVPMNLVFYVMFLRTKRDLYLDYLWRTILIELTLIFVWDLLLPIIGWLLEGHT